MHGRSQSGVFGAIDQPIRTRLATLAASALLLLSLGSCGGGGGSGNYTIGGSVSGLPKGAQLQLDLAFTDAVTGMQSGGSTNIVANGPFIFPVQIHSGDMYDVYWTPNSGPHLHIMAECPWTLQTRDIPSSIANFVTCGSAARFRGAVTSFSWWLSLGSSCNSPDPEPSLAES